MKYFFRVFVVLVLVVAVVVGAYFYMNGNNPLEKKEEMVSLTTVTKQPATEKVDNRVLLASLKKEGFKLYKNDRMVILEHNGKEFEFENWSDMLDKEKPRLYYSDFDSDGKKELLVKGVCGTYEETGKYEYELYLLKPTKVNGKEDYTVIVANRTTWSNILDKYIRENLNQLANCDKIVQFAMNKAGENTTYDKKTGIATNGHPGYFRALQDKDGHYLTVDTWNKGHGIYVVTKDNEIVVDVSILVKYKEISTLQQAGVIQFALELDEKGAFVPKGNSLGFQTDKKYRVAIPTVGKAADWTYTENNENKSAAPSSKAVDWLQYKTAYDRSINTQTIDFSGNSSDIGYMEKIVVKSNKALIYAKPGVTFDADTVQKNNMSVVINTGKDTECDIAYKSSLISQNGNEVLEITFDRAYARNEIEAITINFGIK